VMEYALELYLDGEEKPFGFSVCVPILHPIPKFDPFFFPDSSEAVVVAGSRGSVMGQGRERPIGSQAAKKEKKEEAAVGKNVETMRKDFTKLVDSTLRKEAFDELIGLAKYYRSIGDREMAESTNKELQELIAANRAARIEEKKQAQLTEAELSSKKQSVPSVVEVMEVVDSSSTTGKEDGIHLPPDDSSEWTDALVERIRMWSNKEKAQKKAAAEEEEEDDDSDLDLEGMVERLTKEKEARLAKNPSSRPVPRRQPVNTSEIFDDDSAYEAPRLKAHIKRYLDKAFVAKQKK
jgi:hypothetical protein